MKVISIEETVEVEGGALAIGAAVGALVVGGAPAFISGGNTGQIVTTILGSVSSFYGGLGMWGSTAATGIFTSFTTLGGGAGALKLQYELRELTE